MNHSIIYMKTNVLAIIFTIVSFVLVGCNGHQHDDNINKPAEPIIISARYLDGEYYGDHFSPGVGNYYIHLSTRGFKDSGNALPNATYYRLDIYGKLYEGDNNSSVPLPEGTYHLDNDNTGAAGTFSAEKSKRLESNNIGYFHTISDFEEGELTIANDKITLKVKIDDREYIVTYAGDTLINDCRSQLDDDVPEGVSTLTEDRVVALDEHQLLYAFYGDYYGNRLHNWIILLWPYDRKGEHIQFDIMTRYDGNATYTGEFTAGDMQTPYSFIRGNIVSDEDGQYMEGSWYYTEDSTEIAPFVDGSLSIVENADATMTVTFNVKDDRGNTISGTWSGMPEEY